VPEEKPVMSAQPRAEIPSDRIAVLHALLGEELVPSALIGTQGAAPAPAAQRVIIAGAQEPSPPPPAAPPPPPQ
jgi:hypothetical protein